MVHKRLVWGLALTAAFLLAVWLDGLLRGGPLLHLVFGALMIGALWEVYSLAERAGLEPLKLLPVVLVACLVAGDYALRAGWLVAAGGSGPWARLGEFYGPMGISLVACSAVLLAAHLVARGPERWLRGAPATLLGFVYVWFFGAHVFAILAMGVGYVLAFLAAAKLGDAGAYFVGRFWGRRRLAPRTSPNKTVEGCVGGLAASAGCCVATAALCRLDGGLAFWAVFGLVVGALAQVGDLVESALKRSAGAKDSGQLLPTFGGVLDLVDSPLFSAPVALWLLMA